MQTKTVVLALAASAAALHDPFPGHAAIKRDLVARQTVTDSFASPTATDDSFGCLTSLESIYLSLPTPPADLISFEETVSITDECHFTIPASLSAEFKSYESEVQSWYDSNSAAIETALSECPQFSSYSTLVDTAPVTYSDQCTTFTAGGTDSNTKTKGSGGKTTATTTGTAAGSTATNAASGKNAVFGAAALAAGFFGVVAAL